MINQRVFGALPDGRQVTKYTMKNAAGASVSVIDYGGIVTSICVPDRQGVLADVALGFDNLGGYLADHGGDTVGRYGNRIAKGRFVLDGVTHQLACNNGENHLHGGPIGFSKKMWAITPETGSNGDRLRMHYVSADGEEHFPGTLDVTVTYGWDDDCNLSIRYEATTDKLTLCNMTNHTYFNLAGYDHGTIRDQILRIEACLQMAYAGGYDHNCVLRKGEAMGLAARMEDPASGRVMEVLTDQPGVQLYTACQTDFTGGKGGASYGRYSGLCLETQHFPDSPNNPQFIGTTVLRPGEKYDTTTIYAFRVKG